MLRVRGRRYYLTQRPKEMEGKVAHLLHKTCPHGDGGLGSEVVVCLFLAIIVLLMQVSNGSFTGLSTRPL